MTRNVLILGESDAARRWVGALAARSGSDLGLVHTGIDPAAQKASGGRIEEARQWGGQAVSAFDEPLAVGTAVAQLAGHADAVIVDRLDDWALRLARRHGQDTDSVEAELRALRSVMQAGLVDLLLLAGTPAAAAPAEAALAQRVLEMVRPLCALEVDARAGVPVVRRGTLEHA